MKEKWTQLLERIDALELRERGLLFITMLVGGGMLWQQLLLTPMELEQKQMLMKIEDLHKEVAVLDREYQAIVERGSRDPDAENRNLLVRYQSRSKQLESSIQQSVAGLIEPTQMARVVEEVLRGRKGLSLLSLHSLPTTALLEEEQAVSAPATDADAAAPSEPLVDSEGVYRHGLRMQLEGEYLLALDYLRALESLPWGLKWSAVEVEMQEYPRALITIQVYTLSMDKEWLGV